MAAAASEIWLYVCVCLAVTAIHINLGCNAITSPYAVIGHLSHARNYVFFWEQEFVVWQ